MFGRSRPVVIDTYGSGRRRRRLPRWLAWLLAGIAFGVAGVLYVQERHLPPRLSAAESARLRADFAQADGDRQRLQGELDQARKDLEAARADGKRLADELAAARQAADRLQEDLAFVAAALPPDPRSGAVEVRAARLAATGKALNYEIALVREAARGKPLAGTVQLVVSGDSARGETTATLEPIAISVGSQQVLRGSQPLPEGLVARQCTIRVLDRPGGQLLGMRVMYVK
jgi:hypothetical protein